MGKMLSFVCQTYNSLPFDVMEMYTDKSDFTGLEWWYNEAVKINRENAKAMKRKY
jgi:hypothetical protein